MRVNELKIGSWLAGITTMEIVSSIHIISSNPTELFFHILVLENGRALYSL
jgi:hypothetical protein